MSDQDMWPLVRQTRYFRRYRQIGKILGRHGLGVVVNQLGLAPLAAMARRTARPTPHTTPERLRLALIALGPTYIKLGQMLSTRPDMVPPAYLRELNRLQDTVPPFDSEQAIAIVEADLGAPLARLFATFEREPFAAASLGQVHAATLPDGSQVVVKIQRP
ncbi:MAG TPA: AarF/UbiB family protein, partial [Roseiflexaceae bacterium]|nr:AarF/UbiB family protein [Roseiflexaceae bacterium]